MASPDDSVRMSQSSGNSQHTRIAILGAGNLGSALAHVLSRQGNPVTLWDHFDPVREEIRTRRTNERFLPGIQLHADIRVADTPAGCVKGADIVIPCVPSRFIEAVVESADDHLGADAVFLNVAKGFAPQTTRTIPCWLEDRFPRHACAHLAGPCLAGEFSLGYPGGIVIAARKMQVAEKVAAAFTGEGFTPVECSDDLEGAALAGILKNSHAIFLGMLDHLVTGGNNLKATALTHCAREMESVLTAFGAKTATIRGLAGLGDLLATGLASDSHNRRLGVRLGKGDTVRQILSEGDWLPEGATATPVLLRMAQEKGLEPPVLNYLAGVLDGTPPDAAGILSVFRCGSFQPR